MNDVIEIKESIRTMSRNKDEVYDTICEVMSVDKSNRVCVVDPINADATIYNVRLQSYIGGSKGVTIFPVVGSKVIVSYINQQTAWIGMFSEIDRISITTEADLKEQINNLTNTLESLYDTLLTFKLSTNMGTTIAVLPDIVTKLNKQKQEVKDFKTEINKIFE